MLHDHNARGKIEWRGEISGLHASASIEIEWTRSPAENLSVKHRSTLYKQPKGVSLNWAVGSRFPT